MQGKFYMTGAVIWKEFRHIFRDRVSCLILFLMPVAILFILGYALSFEVRHLNIAVCNPLHSQRAESLFVRLDANNRVKVTGRIDTTADIDKAFARDNNRAVLVWGEKEIEIFVDGTSALLGDNVYNCVGAIVADFITDGMPPSVRKPAITTRFLYNPALKKEYMPIPGLVMMIFIIVSAIVFGTAVNREKIQGSYKLLRMTKLSPLELIAGKALPYFLISLVHVFAVWLSCLWFGIQIVGNLALFLSITALFSISCMSLGLMLAAWLDRPVDLLILSFILIFLPNMLLSGFLFPVSSITGFFGAVIHSFPGTAYMSVFRDVAYKGLGVYDAWPSIAVLFGNIVAGVLIALPGLNKRVALR
ncbi:MAG: ABC transporter permease [Bacteroidales bacterium]|nr:ABC transporter permease [Bacteroidales bacterium]